MGLLLVGLCIYVLSTQWLESRWVAVLVACCVMVLLGTPLVFFRILHRAQARLQLLEHEISELRARETLLVDKAHHDDLTGLANRGLLADRFRGATERAKRSRTSFALLMIDLNDFKAINDTYGHAVGDKVLVTIARRLAGAVRASDTVARIGGDEFVLLIEAIEHSTELAQIGQKLLDTLAEPIFLSSSVVLHTGASVGLSLYPADGVDLNDLLYVADQAMYECKTTGMMSLV